MYRTHAGNNDFPIQREFPFSVSNFFLFHSSNSFPLQGFSRFWCAVLPVVEGEAGFASNGLSMGEDAIFPSDSGDTSPCVPGVVIELYSPIQNLPNREALGFGMVRVP
jgi:hypothetical protein